MKTAPLGEIAEIVSGATPKTGDEQLWGGDIMWATPADLSKLDGPYISFTPRTISEAGLKSCAAQVLPAGSVLLSSRAPIGHVAINTVPMATNQGFKSLIPRPGVVDAKYLFHWLRANTAYLQSLGNGATFKEISKAVVSKVDVPLPPLDEQRRIAAILDQAQRVVDNQRAVHDELDVLAQAVFQDMFADPATWPDRWPMGRIGDMTEDVQYGTSAKAGDAGQWPIVRMGNVTDAGRLDLTDLKWIDLTDGDVPKYTLERGDLLFNRTNSKEKVGKTCVVNVDQPLAFAGYLVRVRFKPQHRAEFVNAYMTSRHGQAVRRSMAKAAVNQANINATEMKSIPIALPSTDLQVAFAQAVEAIDVQRHRQLEAIAGGLELASSLQARAFAGQL